jgi:glycosyltransferase involved in cell wall biosynthesis
MPPQTVDVSAVIPCYNQGRYLAQGIESILAQRALPPLDAPPRIEIIVVNDGSPDNTREVAATFGDKIIYVEQPNGRVARARNRGLLEARGEFLHFMDADDFIAPDFYARILAAARAAPDAGAFYGDCMMADESGNALWAWNAEPLPEGDQFHACLRKLYGMPSTVVIRRAAMDRAGLWNPQFEVGEDWDMWIRLAACGWRALAVPGAQVMYRRHDASISGNFEKVYYSNLRMLRSHAGHHGKCPECRRSVRQGIRNLREYCLRTSYWPSMTRYKRTEGRRAAISFLVRTAWSEPAIAAEVIRNVARRLRKPAAKPAPLASSSVAASRR